MSRLTRLRERPATHVGPARPWPRAVAALLVVALAPAVYAQTIVPNPNLDTQLAPWAQFLSTAPDPLGSGAVPVWQTAPDVNASAASGSVRARLSAGKAPANAASGVAQCFNFAAPESVTYLNYGMSFQAPAGTVLDGSVSANVEIRLFSGAGCSGFISGGTQGQTLSAANVTHGTWYVLRDSGFVPMQSAVTVASAQVRGYLRRTGATPTQADYPIDLDHFVLVLNSSTPVELIRFDIE